MTEAAIFPTKHTDRSAAMADEIAKAVVGAIGADAHEMTSNGEMMLAVTDGFAATLASICAATPSIVQLLMAKRLSERVLGATMVLVSAGLREKKPETPEELAEIIRDLLNTRIERKDA